MKHINIIRRAMTLVAVMFLALASAVAQTNYTTYIDANGNEQKCYNYETVNQSTETLNTGWYLVEGDITISSGITVSGAVNLILADGKTLTVTGATGKAGITVSTGNSLTIYGQAESTGALTATGTATGELSMGGGAGIGGDDMQDAGTIIINGGIITASGNNGGAGIGGGANGTATTIKINRGTVHADGSLAAAGIGAGDKTEAVAKIGTTRYKTLTNAFAGSEDNDEIVMLKDYGNEDADEDGNPDGVEEVITVTKNVALNIGEYNLYFAGKNVETAGTVFYVAEDGETPNVFTIKGDGGSITSTYGLVTLVSSYSGVVVEDGCTLNVMEGGSLITTNNEYGLCGRTVKINGGTFNITYGENIIHVGTSSDEAEYTVKDTLTIKGGIFNIGKEVEGEVEGSVDNIFKLSKNSVANISNCIIDNKISIEGIYLIDDAVATLNNVTMSGIEQLFLATDGAEITVNSGTYSLTEAWNPFGEEGTITLKGGTYKFDPEDVEPNRIDPYYKSVYREEEELWEIVPKDFYQDPDGTYHIRNLAGLQEFANSVNTDHVNYSGKTIVLDDGIDMESAGNWTPIAGFGGTFDGQDKTISGLVVNGAGNLGFFGATGGATIKNLKISGASITGTGSNVAVLVGAAGTSTIDNVEISGATVTVTVTKGSDDTQYTGGIAGTCSSTITNSKISDSKITGYDQVGAVAGFHWCGSITDCTATGNTVEATSERAGGLVGKIQFAASNMGESSMSINNNTISGTAKAPDFAGGITAQIMGDCDRYEIKNNIINVTCTITDGEGETNPIGCLRDGQNAAFTQVLAAKITFNTWTEAQWPGKEKGFVYSNVASSVNPQKIWNVDPYVAKIGETKYLTLAEAIAAATAGQTVEIIKPDTYSVQTLTGSNYTIEATVEGVSFEHTPGYQSWVSSCENVTVKNITWNVGNENYQYFKSTNLYNCTVNGMICTHTANTFTNCTFNQTDKDWYNCWTYGDNVTFDGCTFNGKGKFLHAYCEGNPEVYNVTVTGCTFNSDRVNKAAVNVKEMCGSTMLKYNVVISNCTTNKNFPAGTAFNPDETLWVIDPVVQVDDRNTNPSTSGITITLDNVKKYPDYVAKNGGKYYFDLHKALEEAAAGETVELLKDVDLNNEEWTPIASFKATFDGNDHTISNLKVTGTNNLGFFGYAEEATIKKLNFTNADISGSNGTYAGVVAGNGFRCNIENVTVTNPTVNFYGGKYVGGIAGGTYTSIRNCTVTKTETGTCTISGKDQVGGLIGYICGASITDCEVNGAVISTSEERAGGLAGKVNIAETSSVNIDRNKVKNTTATAPDMAGGITAQIMGDMATYTIKDNEIGINCTAPVTNPIGCLRNGQNAAFTGSLAANITGNSWTNTTYNSDFVAYTNVPDGVTPQVIWRTNATSFYIGEDGAYHIANLAGLKAFRDVTNQNIINMSGKTVKLESDINLNNEEWTPIDKDNITFDGGDHTISNLTIPQKYQKNVGFIGKSDLGTVLNLTINNANVAGINHVAAVLGHGVCAKIENCHVNNATITTVVYNNDDGDKAGAICGYLSGESVAWAKNCTVTNCTVNGYRDCGSVVGIANGSAEVSGCTVNKVTLNNYQSPDYKEYGDDDSKYAFGEVVGQKAAAANIHDNQYENVSIKRYKQQQQ